MLNSKIGLKLTFGVALTILVVIAIFAYFSIQSENRSLLTEVERAAHQYSEHLKADRGTTCCTTIESVSRMTSAA